MGLDELALDQLGIKPNELNLNGNSLLLLLISILADGDVLAGFDFEMQQIAWCTGDNDDVKRLLWADAFYFCLCCNGLHTSSIRKNRGR